MIKPSNSTDFHMKGEIVNFRWLDVDMKMLTKSVLIIDNDSSYDRMNDCFAWSYLVMDSYGNTFWVDADEVESINDVS